MCKLCGHVFSLCECSITKQFGKNKVCAFGSQAPVSSRRSRVRPAICNVWCFAHPPLHRFNSCHKLFTPQALDAKQAAGVTSWVIWCASPSKMSCVPIHSSIRQNWTLINANQPITDEFLDRRDSILHNRFLPNAGKQPLYINRGPVLLISFLDRRVSFAIYSDLWLWFYVHHVAVCTVIAYGTLSSAEENTRGARATRMKRTSNWRCKGTVTAWCVPCCGGSANWNVTYRQVAKLRASR